MKLISVGIEEDIFDLVSNIVEDNELRVHNAESTFVNALLRKALGVGSAFAVDPLVEDVIDELEGSHDPSACETCA